MAEKHYNEQKQYARHYLIPFLRQKFPALPRLRVLEVGCAEAGVLHELNKAGIQCLGIELQKQRVDLALQKDPHLDIAVGDITDPALPERIGKFDLIVMREVIEHVPDRENLFSNLQTLLNPGGYVYITFPPRFSPFAGHQQNGRTLLRFVPFLHYLPAFLIKWLGKLFAEPDYHIQNIIINYRHGLTLARFIRYVRTHSFKILLCDLFLIRPVYRYRYGLKPVTLPHLPLLREIFALGCETILQKAKM